MLSKEGIGGAPARDCNSTARESCQIGDFARLQKANQRLCLVLLGLLGNSVIQNLVVTDMCVFCLISHDVNNLLDLKIGSGAQMLPIVPTG